MPAEVGYTLAWSSARLAYELHAHWGGLLLLMDREGHEWFAWLEQGISFAFAGQTATCLVRRERKQRGEAYWYAYARNGGTLTKKYVGKTAAVTPARLEQIAQRLRGDTSEMGPPQKPSPFAEVRSVSDALAAAPSREDVASPSRSPRLLDEPHPLLLAAKFSLPRHHQAVHRPHLTMQLQQRQERGGVTLLSAPAGYGKTTAIADWLASSHLRAAWLWLDPQDNDPLRFLSYLIAAFQTLEPTLGTVALAMLRTPQPPTVQMILTALVNDLLSYQRGMLTLVLDDYQVITAQPVHDALDFLLTHVPSHLHLLLATRADPPLPLARLRSQDRLTELRASDLQFETAEAQAFLHRVMRVDLPPDAIDALRNRTEGWVAGLQLAALALRGHVDVSAFLASFTGSHHYVLDYLSEEVLARQPASLQDFLLHTCILDRLTGSLCEAVTGQSEGQATLERIERANLFLVALDDERQWYRYHQLFAEMLRNRLQARAPALAPELHRRASSWYEQHGLLPQAVEHAIAAHDVERVAHLIEPAAQPMLEHGDIALLRGWMENLPASVVRARPRLFLTSAWLSLLTGQIEVAEKQLRDAEQIVGAHDEHVPQRAPRRTGVGSNLPDSDAVLRDGFRGEVAAMRGTIALARQNVPSAIEYCQQALPHLPEDNFYVRSLLLVLLGQAYRASGDLVAAGHVLAEASTTSQAAGNVFLSVGTMVNLAEIYEMRGQLHRAADMHRQAIGLGATPDGRPLPFAGPAYVGMGKLLREWNDLDAAAEQLTQGRELSRAGGLESSVFDAAITLALVQQAQGHAERAGELLQQAHSLAERANNIWAANRVGAFRARLFLMQGRLEAALQWVQESDFSVGGPPSAGLEVEYLTLARVLLAESRASSSGSPRAQAVEWLGRLLREASDTGRTGSVIEILMLSALALHAGGDLAAAQAHLWRALALAEPQGYMRLFVDEGEPLSLLLRSMAQQSRRATDPRAPGHLRQYLQALLYACGLSARTALHPSPVRAGAPPLPDPLSERELEVLRLLAAGRANQEIADELVIVLGTVKTHLRSLYRKLDVHTRLQAIARAKALQLL